MFFHLFRARVHGTASMLKSIPTEQAFVCHHLSDWSSEFSTTNPTSLVETHHHSTYRVQCSLGCLASLRQTYRHQSQFESLWMSGGEGSGTGDRARRGSMGVGVPPRYAPYNPFFFFFFFHFIGLLLMFLLRARAYLRLWSAADGPINSRKRTTWPEPRDTTCDRCCSSGNSPRC